MFSPRTQFQALVEAGRIPVEKVYAAQRLAGLLPSGQSWLNFLQRLMLWLAGIAFAVSVLFFLAYNWSAMSHFIKFAMVEVLLILTIAGYWWVVARQGGPAHILARVLLMVAALTLGGLLALVGQTYQTGADPWQLFAAWTVLLLPWVLIGRFSALWLLWMALVNLTIILYDRTFPGLLLLLPGSSNDAFGVLFLLNTAFLLIWECFIGTIEKTGTGDTLTWISARWPLRFPATAAGWALTFLVLSDCLFTWHSRTFSSEQVVIFLAWLVWFFTMYGVYRWKRPDLYMLAGIFTSAITVIVAAVVRLLDRAAFEGYLFLALLVIALASGAAVHLKKVHRDLQS